MSNCVCNKQLNKKISNDSPFQYLVNGKINVIVNNINKNITTLVPFVTTQNSEINRNHAKTSTARNLF